MAQKPKLKFNRDYNRGFNRGYEKGMKAGMEKKEAEYRGRLKIRWSEKDRSTLVLALLSFLFLLYLFIKRCLI